MGGGGDARVGAASLYCAVCPAHVRLGAAGGHPPHHNLSKHAPNGNMRARSIVGVEETPGGCTTVVVEDPDKDEDLNGRDDDRRGVRRYRVAAAGEKAADAVVADVAEWVMAGFDATVVAFGQAGTGKSHALFGGGGGSHEHDAPGIASRTFIP